MWIGRSARAGSRAIQSVSPSRSKESMTAQRAPSFHLSRAVTDRSRAASWGAARSAVPVLLLVVGAELAGLERSPPRLVLPVPADRRGQRVAERVARPPAEPPYLGGVERVATVVPGPVLHG